MNKKERQDALDQKFQHASHAYPEITEQAEPLNYGTYGLVIRHIDNSLTKILFTHPSDNQMQMMAVDGFEREIKTLRLLNGTAADDFSPTLLEEPRHLDHARGYIGSYRMSPIDGTTYPWHRRWPPKDLAASDTPDAIRQSGQLLARFHTIADDLAISRPHSDMADHYGRDVKTLEALSDDENERLRLADSYLKASSVPGAVHGDFHGGNILYDGLRPRGLIDFARTAYAQNRAYDFAAVPLEYLDDFCAGYEEAGGIHVPKAVIHATGLSIFTNYALERHNAGKSEAVNEILPTIRDMISDFDAEYSG